MWRYLTPYLPPRLVWLHNLTTISHSNIIMSALLTLWCNKTPISWMTLVNHCHPPGSVQCPYTEVVQGLRSLVWHSKLSNTLATCDSRVPVEINKLHIAHLCIGPTIVKFLVYVLNQDCKALSIWAQLPIAASAEDRNKKAFACLKGYLPSVRYLNKKWRLNCHC